MHHWTFQFQYIPLSLKLLTIYVLTIPVVLSERSKDWRNCFVYSHSRKTSWKRSFLIALGKMPLMVSPKKNMRFHTCIDLSYYTKVVLEEKATHQQWQITWTYFCFCLFAKFFIVTEIFSRLIATLYNHSGQVFQVLRHQSSLEALFLRPSQDRRSIAC